MSSVNTADKKELTAKKVHNCDRYQNKKEIYQKYHQTKLEITVKDCREKRSEGRI